MKKLLYVTDALAIHGGLERVLIDKANWLSTYGDYEVHILTTNQGNHPLPFSLNDKVFFEDLKIGFNHQYSYTGIKRLIFVIKLQKLFRKCLYEKFEEIKPDVVVCVRQEFVADIIKVRENIPLVFESHSSRNSYSFDNSTWRRKIRVQLMLRAVRHVQKVVALTIGDSTEWKKLKKEVCVIPNVVNLNNTEAYSSCKEKSVIFVGRFSEQKDIVSLLEIWKIVNRKHSDWQLKIFGDGELKEIYLSAIKDMNANIFVHEPIVQIIEEYKKNSILLLTSFYEPFGLVLPEAMSCGLPVIAFDCPYGPSDIITDGVDGFLIKNRDIKAFADKVCQLIENEDLRRQMGQKGIVSSQRYRADVIMPQWISLFDELISGQ